MKQGITSFNSGVHPERKTIDLLKRDNFMRCENPGIALVTGASAGIGKSFAKQLANQGFNLILVARRKELLDKLAESLQREYGIMVEVLAADLSKPNDVAKVEKKISETQTLDVLVNNAGFGGSGKFSEAPIEKEMEMKAVHVDAPIHFCRAAVKLMVKRGRGTIINLSSLASFFPIPGAVMYSATKAFLKEFSASLAMELFGTGVKVQALCPGFTQTEFHSGRHNKIKKFDKSAIPKALWMKADEIVRLSLAAVQENKVVFIPGFKNRFLLLILNTWFGRRIAKRRLKKMGRM